MPLDVNAFLQYLETTASFNKTPSALRVVKILEEMELAGLLVVVGESKPSFAGFGKHYLYLPTIDNFRQGPFCLVPVLGPEYIYHLCAPILVHITGRNGDEIVSGTGIVVDEGHILTCGHVISEMTIDQHQVFQSQRYEITDAMIFQHANVDIAVIRVDGPRLSKPTGIVFQAPVVAQPVYTLGFPKLPGLRDASVTIQQGSVTNASVTSLSGDSLFLYSAIARPGNSGGPVVSADGYVVGISVADSIGLYSNETAFSPHYAGVPAQEIVKAVTELGLGIDLHFESYE